MLRRIQTVFALVDYDLLTVHILQMGEKMSRILREKCAIVARVIPFDFALRQIGRVIEIRRIVYVAIAFVVVVVVIVKRISMEWK